MPDTVSELRYAEWKEPAGIDVPLEGAPDATQQWAVKFDVLLGSWIIGTDQGILWFDDQSLYIVGKLTSFAVPGHRISEAFEKRITFIRPFERQLSIPLEGDPGVPITVQLDIVVNPPFVPENIALLDSLRCCRSHADRELEGQLPPTLAWKNAQSIGQLLTLQTRCLIGVTAAAFVSIAFIAFLMTDFGLNAFVCLALLAIAAAQIHRWNSPKLVAITKAIRSYRTYADQAQVREVTGEAVTA